MTSATRTNLLPNADVRRRLRGVAANRADILVFYGGSAPDHRGRYLREILKNSDDWLESTHDYIQWLFPLSEVSAFNPHAPVLEQETIRRFRSRPDLQQGLRMSFLRMLDFYGFEVRVDRKLAVRLSAGFKSRAANWLTCGNHNHLRITRILKSLRLLGLQLEAAAFFDCLVGIYASERTKEQPAITGETFRFWLKAVVGQD